MSTASPIITIDHVSKYFGSFKALDDICLEVKTGEKVVVIGPSGSGKSTLLRAINQLEKIHSGSIIIDNRNICNPAEDINQINAK